MTEKTPRKLLSLVALIYFPFIVPLLLKWEQNDYNLDENDIIFINSFKKAWYLVIFLTIVTIILFCVSFYYSIDLIWNISFFATLALVLYVFYNVFLIFSNKQALLFTNADIKDLNVNKVESMNFEYILTYVPFLSTYKFFTKTYTKEQEYRVKEANLFYFIWGIIAFWAIFSYSLFSLFYVFLLFILVRAISLFFWVDFLPDSIKKIIYESYKNSPYELFAFFCAFVAFCAVNTVRFVQGKKNTPYLKFLHQIKENLIQTYELNSVLKNPKKYLFLILSYLLLFLILAYYIYVSIYSFSIFVYLFWIAVLSSYFILNYYTNKTVLTIPILTPIIKFIVKKFN